LVAGPWFIGTMIATPEFLAHFIWKHNVMRFTTAFNHQQPFWFYVPVILVVMFPASQLLWTALNFLGTRKPEVRRQRTQAHGYLLIVPLWLFLFFSLSQAKLPTYILPAVPTLCLLLAAILDVNIFKPLESEAASLNLTSRSWFNFRTDALSTYYRRLPVRLGLNMAFWIVVISTIMLYALPSSTVSETLMGWSVALTVLLTTIACHRRSHPVISWSANCLLALFLSSLITHRIVPAVSQQRSIQNAVAQMKQQPEFSESQVVYFARDNFASQVLLGDLPIKHFPETETFKAAKYLEANPTSILVSTPDHIEELRKTLDWNIRISKHESARHVYLTSHTEPATPRVADRAERDKF
jgi:4-amino-4-deoxy-L-arabinose transferase-like glycosyltransferase